MKAISLWQPHASLLVGGEKVYETRSWSPPKSLIGQRIAIHAAKALHDLREIADYIADLGEIGGPGDDTMMAFNNAVIRLGFMTFGQLPRGAVIGTAILEAAVPTTSLIDPGPFGDFSPGRFAWRMGDTQTFKEPIPFRGMQGFFHVPDSVLASASR